MNMREFAKKEPDLYGAIIMFFFLIMFIFFMVGDLVLGGSSDLSPFYALPFLILGPYYLYRYISRKK